MKTNLIQITTGRFHFCLSLVGSIDFKLNIPGQIIQNIHFLDLVLETGTVFLKESEYFLNTNLKLL